MSEASGPILIKAPAAVLEAMLDGGNTITWEGMSALFAAAGIVSLVDSHPLLRFCEGVTFSDEGIKRKRGFLYVCVFGDQWMSAMQSLLKTGQGIEVYGYIGHEWGFNEYYALNDKGERFFETIDFESDDEDEEVDEQAVFERWLSHVPPAVQAAFPDVFERSGEDEE
jgi:hypothetical protein